MDSIIYMINYNDSKLVYIRTGYHIATTRIPVGGYSHTRRVFLIIYISK